jgi:hypothetical protein
MIQAQKHLQSGKLRYHKSLKQDKSDNNVDTTASPSEERIG